MNYYIINEFSLIVVFFNEETKFFQSEITWEKFFSKQNAGLRLGSSESPDSYFVCIVSSLTDSGTMFCEREITA